MTTKPIVFATYRVYANLSAGWTDITGYITSDIVPAWGISGNGPMDCVSDAGQLTFTVKNQDNIFSPGNAASLVGWGKGTQIKYIVTYDGTAYTRFFGVVGKLTPHTNVLGNTFLDVFVDDWIVYAINHPIINPPIQFNQTADKAIQTILATMPIQPLKTSFDSGINVFSTTFDLVRAKTVAYSEMVKLVTSELGYLYLIKDKFNGETLVFENAFHRTGLTSLSLVPMATDESSSLQDESGNIITDESGNAIIVDSASTFSGQSTMMDMDVTYGNNVLNRFALTVYPRRFDSSLVVLYSLGSPVSIGAGQTIIIQGNYIDPLGGGTSINGYNMVTPAATTDYLLNSKSDGSGTNLTGTATVVASYGTGTVIYTITNGGTVAGYVTLLHARGYGIYAYAKVEYDVQDNNSVSALGYIQLSIDQKYQQDISLGSVAVNVFLMADRNPRLQINSITFCANYNEDLMLAALSLDVGSLIKVSEANMSIWSYYFIQNVQMTHRLGGILFCKWGLREFLSLSGGGLAAVGAVFGGPGCTDNINFGSVSWLSNLANVTYSAWIYDNGGSYNASFIGGNTILSGPGGDNGGIYLNVHGDHTLHIYSNEFTSPGEWASPANSIPTSTWTQIIVSYNKSSASAVPVIYINGASVAVTTISTPSGTATNETGMNFMIGNLSSVAHAYSAGWNGTIQDVRVYNYILSASDIVLLYYYGIHDPKLGRNSGILFEGPVVKTSDLALYITGIIWSANNLVMDDINHVTGTPGGSVVGVTFA